MLQAMLKMGKDRENEEMASVRGRGTPPACRDRAL